MAKKPVLSRLNATTFDILNTIRNNLSPQYRERIPEIHSEKELPAVGDILYGAPNLLEEMYGELAGRIAFVNIQTMLFSNGLKRLKKGMLLTGETIEQVFTEIVDAHNWYNDQSIAERELGEEKGKIEAAFLPMNYKTFYKRTISNAQIRSAFTSLAGVQDLIMTLSRSLYTAADTDEWYLFKYLIIKSVNKGLMRPINAGSTPEENVIAFREYSNRLTFPSRAFNEAGVLTATPVDKQAIFMSAHDEALYDVTILSEAFHMEKAEYLNRSYRIDSFTEFDNSRFDQFRAEGGQMPEVTAEELATMASVKAVLCDEEWFQVYDNLFTLTTKPVESKLAFNNFLHVWKTIGHNPFANAVVFLDSSASIALPSTITATVVGVDKSEVSTAVSIEIDDANVVNSGAPQFVQTVEAAEAGVGVHPYGGYLIPAGADAVTPELKLRGDVTYVAATTLGEDVTVGTQFTFAPAE